MKSYLNKFKEKNIVIIGDIMLDKYIFGNVDRISPEAPVPIISVNNEKYAPGGSANAANNISTLTGNASLFGIVGNDSSKQILLDELKINSINTDGIITDSLKPTIQKIRVLGHSQQLLRIDYEENGYINKEIQEKLINKLKISDKIDAVIISDYAKGLITKELMMQINSFCNENEIKIIVDPKPKHKSFYKGAFIITPNLKEAEEMTNIKITNDSELEKAGNKLMEELNCNVLITTGEKGMSLFEKNKEPLHIPTVAQEVFDVSGAGDTVIATLSLAIASNTPLKEAALLANHAAGIKVGKLGTSPVYLEELEKNLQ